MLRPLGSRIVVQPIEKALTSPGGLALVHDITEVPNEGIVVACGPDVMSEVVYTGARVCYGKFAGQKVTLDNQALVILVENEVLGVL